MVGVAPPHSRVLRPRASNGRTSKREKNDGPDAYIAKTRSFDVGIHSQTWALSVVPQKNCPLLNLPLELRERIYKYAYLNDDRYLQKDIDGRSQPPLPRRPILELRTIVPEKQDTLPNFKHFTWHNAQDYSDLTKTDTILSSLSRQTYLETTGSSLLYRFARFSFLSPSLMIDYLAAIHPSHLTNIQTLDLHINMREPNPKCVPRRMFRSLSTLVSLKTLNIELEFTWLDNYRPQPTHRPHPIHEDILASWAAMPWDLLRMSDSFVMSLQHKNQASPSAPGERQGKTLYYDDFDWGDGEVGWEGFATRVRRKVGEGFAKVEVLPDKSRFALKQLR